MKKVYIEFMSVMNKATVRIVQVGLILIPIALFGWLLTKDLVPTGELVVKHSVGELSPFINRILPGERALDPIKNEDGDWLQQIIDDPVYFTVEPPRHFDEIELVLRWQNEGVAIVEIGGLASETGSQYFLIPLQNQTIDNSDWFRLDESGIIFLQRNQQYGSLADFLADLPDRGEVATYHYPLSTPFYLEDYVPSVAERTLDVSLRGFHEFKTYIKNETLNLEFAYMDMNRDIGEDPVQVIVTNEAGETVAEVSATDDGVISDSAIASSLERLELAVPGLSEGVYKVELRVGRDIFWRRLTTTQQKIVFLNNLYLADEVGYQSVDRPVSFWTEAKNLSFQTHHADGAQEVLVGGELVRIPEPYEVYTTEVSPDGIVEVYSPQGDLIVYSTGHMAFSPEQYFNPDPVRLSWNTDLDRLGVNYIVAKYQPPTFNDGWYYATATFDTAWLVKEDDAWKFTISVPGIDNVQGELRVSDIDLTFFREPLTWRKIIQEIKERL